MDEYRNKCIITLLLLTLLCINAEVKVENRGYTDVLVAFSPTVSVENGKELLEKVQGTVTEASEVLSNAIGLRISKLTFLLPITWNTSNWENITVGNPSAEHTSSAANILVEGVTDSAFGKYPFAVQYGGCGVPGHQIAIPELFLIEDTAFPKGKLLAREWLKYRYGVFDENGFTGDDMYPLYYGIPGGLSEDVRITDCTNYPVNYTFRDVKEVDCMLKIDDQTGFPVDENEGCYIYPDQESIENISSSLMYFQEKMPNMEHICGSEDHPHSSTAPNKHNALCQGKSMWDVLKMSPDFDSAMTNDESEVGNEIEFSYVQERNPKVFVAWDNTQKIKPKKTMIFRAIGRLLYDLPIGSKYALYPYDNEEENSDDILLVKLTGWPEGRDKSITSDFASDADACVTCAISKAINSVESSDDSLKGSIIVIAASEPANDEDLIKRIDESQLCLVVIGFTDLGATEDSFQNYIAASPCGLFYALSSEEGDEVVFEKLYNGMESVIPRLTWNTVTSTVKTDYISFEKEMLIPFDETAEKFTLWFIGQSPEDKNFICKSDDKPVTMQKDVDQNFVAISFKPTKSDVSCSLRFKGISPVLTQVQKTTKPGKYFNSHVWIKDTTDDPQQQMPVIIYANVNFGAYPVKNAEIKATVTSPDGQNFYLDLYDDGRGDPDITANDGIYSRYFTNFQSAGDYTVQITASDNGGQARAAKEGADRCCGSNVKTPDSSDIPLGTFQKIFETSFKAISGRPPYGYKPSRIVDLRVASINESSIVLRWTAPGGEADSGTVQIYTIKSFISQEEAISKFEKSENSATLNFTTFQPQERGNTENLMIDISENFEDNTVYFIAMRTANINGQISETSNAIEIFVPDRGQVTTDAEETSSAKNDNEDTKPSSADKRTVGIIIGVVIGVIVAVALVYIIIYFLVLKPKRKAEKKAARKPNPINQITNSNATAENHVLNPVNSIPADVLLKHHKEVVNAKNEHKDPPIFKEEDIEVNQQKLNEPDNTEAEYSTVNKNKSTTNSETVPPKSPKRMTFV